MNSPIETTFPSRIGFEEAVAIIRAVAHANVLAAERVPVARCAGRVLAQDLIAPLALPSFDNSAMDGYAVRHRDLDVGGNVGSREIRLRLVGEQFAGHAADLAIGAGECMRITTGAVLPAGADAVVIKEDVRIDGDDVLMPTGIRAGAYVRHVGEDVHAGDLVLRAGDMLTPAAVGLAAALGCAELHVTQRPTVAVFTTGDELRRPGEPLAPGEIYDCNRALLMALLVAAGLEPVAWPNLPDDPARIAVALRDAASAFDVVITCGGVSAGEKDYLPAFVAGHGQIHFWKVRMRPGMPLLFGSLDRARLLCLPGNPVSVLATFLTLGRSLLDGLQGRAAPRPRLFARLAQSHEKKHARLEFLRGRLQSRDDGVLLVVPNSADGSHRMRAAADSNALIVLPEGLQSLAIDDVVEVLRYGD